ncbi:hypothetical protein BT69DRAFT_1282641 [Atractiella rhizophila]|nr:hypothetical protein BT69DRAFT_1282641 [Atractiella rhizophila]
MKKAFELSVLTGTQVLLLIVSESGTEKLQPIVVEKEGKELIQRCLTAPNPEEPTESWPPAPTSQSQVPPTRGGKKDAFLRHYNPPSNLSGNYPRNYGSETIDPEESSARQHWRPDRSQEFCAAGTDAVAFSSRRWRIGRDGRWW